MLMSRSNQINKNRFSMTDKKTDKWRLDIREEKY